MISAMETGDTLSVCTDDGYTIYVKNDTGRTVYMYGENPSSPSRVLFTDKQTSYADFPVKFPNDNLFNLDSDETISWALVTGESYATVTIQMSDSDPDPTPEKKEKKSESKYVALKEENRAFTHPDRDER